MTEQVDLSQVNKLINSKDWNAIKSSDLTVKREIAKQGYHLDILICDRDPSVRLEVAKHSFGLEQLVNDISWEVRREIAKQGYHLDILKDDEVKEVLEEVEKHSNSKKSESEDSSRIKNLFNMFY